MKKLIVTILLFAALSVGYSQNIPNVWAPAAGTDTYTTNVSFFGGNYANKILFVKFANTNTGAATLNVGGIGAVALRYWDGDSWEVLTAGYIDTDFVYQCMYITAGNYFGISKSDASGGGGGDLLSTNNLSDLTNAGTARTNLGLGTLATQSITFGTGVATALAVNIGSAGAPVLLNGAGGTPSSLTGTNITGIPQSGVTSLTSDLALKAPLASPTFTGTVTIPTASANDNSTKAASTAYTDAKVADAINDATTAIAPSQNAVFDALAIVYRNYLVSASTSTTSSTITLDFQTTVNSVSVSSVQKMFYGSATFATGKTMANTNATNALVFNFTFEVTSLAGTITMPSGWLMADTRFNSSSRVWTPDATGKFEMSGTYNGTNWFIKISGSNL